MVKENAAGAVQAITLAVIDGGKVSVEFGTGVRTARVKRRALRLGRRRDTEHLAGRSLIEPALQARAANRFQQPQSPYPYHVACVFGNVEANLHMALGAKIVD